MTSYLRIYITDVPKVEKILATPSQQGLIFKKGTCSMITWLFIYFIK